MKNRLIGDFFRLYNTVVYIFFDLLIFFVYFYTYKFNEIEFLMNIIHFIENNNLLLFIKLTTNNNL